MKNKKICLILDLRMPLFLADFTLLEIGKQNMFFDVERTEKSFRERFEKVIRPLFQTASELSIKSDFKLSIFFSGNFIQLLKDNFPDEVIRVKELIDSGVLEIIGGTYSNTLASLYSMEVFEMDLNRHRKIIKQVFDVKPNVFMNTENIYSNSIAVELKSQGYRACFSDHISWYLNGKHPRQVFKALVKGSFQVMIMEYASGKLLEDHDDDELKFVKLIPYMETQGKDWRDRINALIKGHSCHTVSEAIEKNKPEHTFSAPHPIGGLARSQGLDGIIKNPMQKKSLETLFSLENEILGSKDDKIIRDWIGLSNVEYLLSMNPDKIDGTRPYDIFIRYMNILTDLKIRLS